MRDKKNKILFLNKEYLKNIIREIKILILYFIIFFIKYK